jgi:O-antigen/teichoic acid export membrane protein
MLATVLVSSLYVLISPVFNVIYPRFTVLVAGEFVDDLKEVYRVGTRLLASVIFPSAMFLAVFGHSVVNLWTGNPILATSVAPIIVFLAIGTSLYGVMYFPYALQLANGDTNLPLTINTVLIVILVPLIIYLSLSYGALGGALAWLLLHVIYMGLGSWLTHRKLLKGLWGRWLIIDIGIPMAISILVGLTLNHTVQSAHNSDLMNVIFGVLITLIATVASVISTPKLRTLAIKKYTETIRKNLLISQ